MNVAPYFAGLTWKRIALVTALCVWAAGVTKLIFINSFGDLMVSALCVGYTCMLFFTVASNAPVKAVPRLAVQGGAIVVGSFLGTILTGLIKGRNLAELLSDRLVPVLITMGLGVGFGAIALSFMAFRARESRRDAELARSESIRHQLEKSVLESRLALMQAQVEPHFLFNTLANVQHLVETDPASASRLLESLIQYLRAALPRMREEASTVGREADMARAFLEIHGMRMGSRLSWSVDVPAALADRPFPPMMLITLVENAIKHGIDPCCDAGAIAVRAREEGGKLCYSVADTGEGISTKKGTGVGLANIRDRLRALHGSQARLVIEENAPRGVVATIEIDLPKGLAADPPAPLAAAAD